MSTLVDHPLVSAMRDAALGSYPPSDMRVSVGGRLAGPCDAVLFFAGHVVVAADLDEDTVTRDFAPFANPVANNPSSGPAHFVGALARRLGDPPMIASILTVAHHRPAYLPGTLQRGGTLLPGWADYRTDVQVYRYRSSSASGTVAIGSGPGGRADVYLATDPEQDSGVRAGRELLAAARTLVPRDELLFGSAPIHDPRALRTGLSSGFEPICTEVLLLTRPRA